MRITLEVSFSFKRRLPPGLTLALPEGADILAALRALSQRFPPIEERLFTRDGRVHRHINALLNGRNVASEKGFETVLHDGDHLTILPPVGGG